MRKKMLSLALALVMCLSLIPTALAAEAVNAADKFTDVPADAWYLDELNYAVNNGYISGTSDTTFSPEGILTRGQFVTILGRMMGVSTASGETRFIDVPATSWYAPYVAWAAEKGYVSGTSSTTFAPENKLTVEQLGTVLANYLNKSGKTVSGAVSVLYTDSSEISGWAEDTMELMAQYNLLVTDTNGYVFPQKQVTRAEAVVSLVRLARGIGMGTEPVISTTPVGATQTYVSTKRTDIVESTDTAEEAAQKIHDALWQFGVINSSMTEMEKAVAYSLWLCVNCDYGYKGELHPLNSSGYAYGALINGLAINHGFSKAYKLLLVLEDIKCCVVTASSSSVWVEAFLDGEWYRIGCGWTDYFYIDGEYDEERCREHYDERFAHLIDGPTYESFN